MKNIPHVHFGFNQNYHDLIGSSKDYNIYLIDNYFNNKSNFLNRLPIHNNDIIQYVNTENELTTDDVDSFRNKINKNPSKIIGIGGTTLDFAKAISNLLTNPGYAKDYQGWNLVKNKGIYKIGIPTISGTGAESSRTCVMINKK